MKKRLSLSLVSLALLVAVAVPLSATADLINPEYQTKICKPGETEVIATYQSKTPFGPRTNDETARYAHNPEYYELAAEGHSFGGSIKYCRKVAQDNTGKILLAVGLVAVIALGSLGGLYAVKRRGPAGKSRK